jgi:hypothetical protein
MNYGLYWECKQIHLKKTFDATKIDKMHKKS